MDHASDMRDCPRCALPAEVIATQTNPLGGTELLTVCVVGHQGILRNEQARNSR